MKLAINGGTPVRSSPFTQANMLGPEERAAVLRVLDGGVLSDFLATWSSQFFGGPEVRSLEAEWASYFGTTHAIAVNSATSGLYAAVGAAGVGPGDEVIVSPYTMTASATAPLVYGAIPVFADIDPDTFCISPETIQPRITPSTRAIIVVDLFGHPADMPGILALAREHGLAVIEDAAQAPGARLNDKYAGAMGDIGVFSLNYHKTIHSGEGGVVVTRDADLAERVQLIRNHGEVVVGAKGTSDITNLVGFNYRMTELEAAIARAQLEKLELLLCPRIDAADYLTRRLHGFTGLTPPSVKPGARHAYYLYVLKVDGEALGVPRARIMDALNAEGLDLASGYVEPIYLAPLYQRRIAFGKSGFPFTYEGYKGTVSYERGICPVAERMYSAEVMTSKIAHASATREDLDTMVTAFEKVWDNVAELQ